MIIVVILTISPTTVVILVVIMLVLVMTIRVFGICMIRFVVFAPFHASCYFDFEQFNKYYYCLVVIVNPLVHAIGDKILLSHRSTSSKKLSLFLKALNCFFNITVFQYCLSTRTIKITETMCINLTFYLSDFCYLSFECNWILLGFQSSILSLFYVIVFLLTNLFFLKLQFQQFRIYFAISLLSLIINSFLTTFYFNYCNLMLLCIRFAIFSLKLYLIILLGFFFFQDCLLSIYNLTFVNYQTPFFAYVISFYFQYKFKLGSKLLFLLEEYLILDYFLSFDLKLGTNSFCPDQESITKSTFPFYYVLLTFKLRSFLSPCIQLEVFSM